MWRPILIGRHFFLKKTTIFGVLGALYGTNIVLDRF